ncbi:MAG TPA: NAD-dependent epimerase/dehydratase family protein [Bacteroidia bacterium]|nr:NAD-dependent epimerase/dehydratase family protein [Bacteroidia bacterium]
MPEFLKIQNKRVLVSGGAGFIGSNLCEDILKEHNEVVCLDNLATGRLQNIDALMENKHFSFVRGDVRNISDCRKAMKGVDLVLHQAALGSVPRSIKDPLSTHEVNVNGFVNMLLAARDEGVKRFVYASSSSVYGDSKALPKTEENIGIPLSPYAVSKTTNELYASVFHRVYGMETIGLRYFNVFGKHQDPEGEYAAAIPKFIRLFLKHHSPEIYGDGSHSRDFTYISNVVRMNHLAASTSNPSAFGQVFNTAVGDRFDLYTMVSIIQAELAVFDPAISAIQIKYGPERPGDIPHSQASIKKAETILHYKPVHRFEEGIKDCIHWYRDKLLQD